jgi:hypothetical protein
VSTDTTNRGTCPVCAHSVRVTGAGTLAEHYRPGVLGQKRCPGSGRRPETPPEVTP